MLEIARRARFSSRPNARSDLFFTMSDNPLRRILRCRRGETIHFRTSRSIAWRASSAVPKAWRRRPGWWSQTGSNRRPPACKAGALPTELWPLMQQQRARAQSAKAGLPSRSSRAALARLRPFGLRRDNLSSLSDRRLVGLGRFELPTSRLSSARSNQLSYKPEPDASDQRSIIRQTRSSDCRLLITDR